MEPTTKRRFKPRKTHPQIESPGDYPDMTTTVSLTETTGMIPAPPQSDAQYKSYQDMHGMQIPKQRVPDDRA